MRRWSFLLHDHPASLNRVLGAHWRTKLGLWEPIREEAAALAKAAVLEGGAATGPVRLVVTYVYTKGGRVRDLDGAAGALKPVIDGLRDGGLIADDDPAHLTELTTRQERGPAKRLVVEVIQQEP